MVTDLAIPTSIATNSSAFMQHIKLPFAHTNQFSKLFLDYIEEKESVKPFYGHFPKLANFELQIQDKQSFSAAHRTVLVEALKQQYAVLSDSPIQQIESLADQKTFTVTTGHQLNIFSGPLYFIYKIVSTINLAKQLKEAYPGYHFVPVYWMATEDHDFAEISYFRLFNKRYDWQKAASGAVGHLSTAGLENIMEQINEMPDFFKKAYGEQKTLAQATREYVHHLFGAEGLIIVDADDHALKSLFKPVIKADLLEHKAAECALLTTQELEHQGYGSQIYIRAINFFYLKDGLRERIERNGNLFSVLNTDIAFTEEQLLQEIEAYPERFSPNVVLRPVYQEVILPNLAYLGGPSEVAYWFQLKGIFDALAVPFPMVMPRNFALYVSGSVAKRMEKLAIQPEELFKNQQQLKDELVIRNTENEISLANELSALAELFEQISAKANDVDKSLEGFVKAEGAKAAKSLNNIEKRLKKAEERKQDTSINQLLKLKEQLFPNGTPQERIDNFMNFYLNDAEFIQKLLNQLDPLDFQMNIFID